MASKKTVDKVPKKNKNLNLGGGRTQIPKTEHKKKYSYERPKEKVYCIECRWLLNAFEDKYECHAESNKVVHPNQQHWLTPDSGFSLREHPRQKNSKNNCPNFEPLGKVQKIKGEKNGKICRP